MPIVGPHQGDQYWIDGLPQQARMFGFAPAEPFAPRAGWWMATRCGGSVGAGGAALPGHTPGHVVFHSAEAGRRSSAMCCLPAASAAPTFGGDHQTLIDSIRQRLWPMGDATVFIPGHGPESTFGHERRTNPSCGT